MRQQHDEPETFMDILRAETADFQALPGWLRLRWRRLVLGLAFGATIFVLASGLGVVGVAWMVGLL